MAPPPTPVTPEMFAEVVAQWRATGRAVPRPGWLRRRVNLREAADLTGLAYNSLRVYRNQGTQARTAGTATVHHMPAEHPDGGWVIGHLATWRANVHEGHIQGAARGFGQGGRWPAWETYLPALRKYLDGLDGRPVSVVATAETLGVERTLARKLLRHIGALPHRYSDPEVLTFMRPLAAEEGRRITQRELMERLRDAGMNLTDRRVTRLWLEAGGRAPDDGRMDGPDRAGSESLRWDGLLTPHQIAQRFRVSDALVNKSRMQREDGLPPLIRPAKWENGDPLYDNDELTTRNDMHAGPVRKGHPLAKELVRDSRSSIRSGCRDTRRTYGSDRDHTHTRRHPRRLREARRPPITPLAV